eukprot:CAMPEP_0176134888 /NCGR_PEP_ID=MMETSP0120_2-20121206/68408_1 /TAXON_ID=160619 /ORGANISM="Kryptoperidinium foliaceum, Strain CCMP 1326" /LENGTH=83 /DNA_ID=CAMNT_0017470549 /DNA_START=51 /DNA_END=299 /DNA_ORIENTATION=-
MSRGPQRPLWGVGGALQGGCGGGGNAGLNTQDQQQLQVFVRRFPVDARCLDYLQGQPPAVFRRVVYEFEPRTPAQADYSALVT